MPNPYNVQLSGFIQAIIAASSQTPINTGFNVLLNCNAASLQEITVPSTLTAYTLPTSPIYGLIVVNLSQTNALLVTYTPNGGTATSTSLTAGTSGNSGGIFAVLNNAETSGGFTAVSLQGTGAAVSAMLFMAG